MFVSRREGGEGRERVGEMEGGRRRERESRGDGGRGSQCIRMEVSRFVIG